MNSLNYVAAVEQISLAKGSLGSSDYAWNSRRAVHQFGIVWGLQRNYLKRFSLDVDAGPGYIYGKMITLNELGEFETKPGGRLTVLGQLSLGFWLNKRK
jgi:hypothetical protein